ncbi:hypothetical protein FOCC_FOCC010908 [Frankliniella occidentalis]|nr:hypothetical protein FOCC_FOCC010908 [Frankliniella occidentalis]
MSKVEKKRKSPRKRKSELEQDSIIKRRKTIEEENCSPQMHEEVETSDHPLLTFHSMELPNTAWAVHFSNGVTTICKISVIKKPTITHSIHVNQNNEIVIEVNEKKIRGFPNNLSSLADFEDLVKRIDKLQLCQGADFGQFNENCSGWVASHKAVRCALCRNTRRRLKRQRKKAETKKEKIKQNKREIVKSLRRSNKRIKLRLQQAKKNVKFLYERCQLVKREKLKEQIKMLPITQQVMILTCFRAARIRGPSGMRYEADWVYQCLLMRIKSPSLYRHIQARKIMPLPSRSQINSYMKKMRPAYGFQQSLFSVLGQKTQDWTEMERHGTILLDEVKLQSGVEFDKNTLEQWGFVDMGKFTPHDQRDEMGDHALVILFQPFQGGWIQSLGCFLSKGNVKGDTLAKILLEGITLCENAGLRVDGVVTDGGKWNRVMWQEFNISENSPSAIHPTDENRKLRQPPPDASPSSPLGKSVEVDGMAAFFFFTLARAMLLGVASCEHKDERIRLFLLTDTIGGCDHNKTPDGTVKRIHWVSVWNEEEKKLNRSQIRYVPRLSKAVIFPSGFEKMNVGMAFTFFSNDMVTGMKMYHDLEIPELRDCQPTVKFMEKINKVAKAMNSGSSRDGLRKGSQHEKAIQDFLAYHKQCRELTKARGQKWFWSESTDIGLEVSLQSALELSHYLIDEVGFRFVMTKRFNQDAIEHFFGNIRQMAAPNPHPDPKLFAQLHRLLAVYSLISPAKKSNVSGVENVKALMDATDDVGREQQERQQEFDQLLDEILEFGTPFEALPGEVQKEHSYFLDMREKYDELLMSFMAGFTAFRRKKVVEDCTECLNSLIKPRSDIGPKDKFAITKECYGGYTYPSDELVKLVVAIEKAVGDCVNNHKFHKDMVFTTLKYLVIDAGCFVGCLSHKDQVTKNILKYYLFMRMFFAADIKNQQEESDRKKRLEHRKQSKL